MRFLAQLALCRIPVTQAQATEFRCHPPDPVSYFYAVQASPDQYRIVVGTFDFDPTLMPYGGGAVLLPNIRPIPAHFSGQSFGPDGPGAAVAFDLTILTSCIMVTCASMTPGIQVLAFIRQAPNGPELDADPCGTPLFAPLAETYATLVECLRDTVCN